jgi:hypothetical protein
VPIEDLFQEDGSQVLEVKFDSVEVILHGARIRAGSGESITLSNLGRYGLRRRDSQVKDFRLEKQELHVTCRQAGRAVHAVLPAPSNPRAEPPFSVWGRGVAVKRLPGWPPAPVPLLPRG